MSDGGEKRPVGRPTKYNDDRPSQIIEFFTRTPFVVATDEEGRGITAQSGKPLLMPCELPTFQKFAADIGVNLDTIYEWANVHPEFGEAKKIAQQLQYDILVQNGLNGGYNSTFAIFTGKAVLHMRDGGEPQNTNPQPLTISIGVEDARIRD